MNPDKMFFELIVETETRNAYEILEERINDLIKKNTGQYKFLYPDYKTYVKRTDEKRNWGLKFEDEILGIVTLTENGIEKEWTDIYVPSSHIWVSSFFINSKWKYQNIGRKLMEAIKINTNKFGMSEILLDCYIDSGFLLPYYCSLNFECIGKKLFKFSEREFNAALMRYKM